MISAKRELLTAGICIGPSFILSIFVQLMGWILSQTPGPAVGPADALGGFILLLTLLIFFLAFLVSLVWSEIRAVKSLKPISTPAETLLPPRLIIFLSPILHFIVFLVFAYSLLEYP